MTVLRLAAVRVAQSVLTLILAITLLFVLLRLGPGDPTAFIVDPTFPEDVKDALMAQFGLDKPVPVQYLSYVGSLLQGDLGRSFFYSRPVVDVLAERLPNTLILTLTSFVVAYALAFLTAPLAARFKGRWIDNTLTSVALMFRSVPLFWVGVIAVGVFALGLEWLPSGGMRSVGYESESFFVKIANLDFLQHLILPAAVSGLYFWGLPFLLLKGLTNDILKEEYVQLAKAKGIGATRVLYRHGIRNALLPIVTAAAVFIGTAAGGIVVIEVVFSWPGLGREIVAAIQRHDYMVAQGAFLMLAGMVIFMNLLADLVYARLDPRVRTEAADGY